MAPGSAASPPRNVNIWQQINPIPPPASLGAPGAAQVGEDPRGAALGGGREDFKQREVVRGERRATSTSPTPTGSPGGVSAVQLPPPWGPFVARGFCDLPAQGFHPGTAMQELQTRFTTRICSPHEAPPANTAPRSTTSTPGHSPRDVSPPNPGAHRALPASTKRSQNLLRDHSLGSVARG